jgi:hypothetical protein
MSDQWKRKIWTARALLCCSSSVALVLGSLDGNIYICAVHRQHFQLTDIIALDEEQLSLCRLFQLATIVPF